MKKKNKLFWERVEQDKREVNKWSKFKQSIVISSETCETGRFIREKEKTSK